jgi:hypothetical protein
MSAKQAWLGSVERPPTLASLAERGHVGT